MMNLLLIFFELFLFFKIFLEYVVLVVIKVLNDCCENVECVVV